MEVIMESKKKDSKPVNETKQEKFNRLMNRLRPGGIESISKEDRIASIEASIAKYKKRIKDLEARRKELKDEK